MGKNSKQLQNGMLTMGSVNAAMETPSAHLRLLLQAVTRRVLETSQSYAVAGID